MFLSAIRSQPIRALFRSARWLAIGLAFALPLPLPAQDEAGEYQVKAAFILNFAKFVTWPDLGPNAEIDVAIWSPDRVHQAMVGALTSKQVGPHPLSLRRYSPEDAAPHILFVHSTREPIPAELRQRLAQAHTLIVGESPGFAARTGVIGFVQRGSNLRFQVNIEGAERSGLKISARLAQLAEIVRSTP